MTREKKTTLKRSRRSRKGSTFDLAPRLAELETAQLIRRLNEEEFAYLFKHTLTQENAYDSLLKADRRRLHREIGDALERLYPELLDENAALLARHYAEAGDDAKTLEYAMRAGDVAMRLYATAEAIAFYTQALDTAKALIGNTAPLLHLYTRRGRAYELNGRFAEAVANYGELEALARTRAEPRLELSARMALATIYAIPSAHADPDKARAALDRSLELARELNDRPAEARVLWIRMLLHLAISDAKGAVQYGEQSLALARELGLREQVAQTLTDVGRAYIAVGRVEESRAAMREADPLWRELGNIPMLAETISNSADFAFFSGDYDEMIRLTDESYRLSQSIGNLWGQAFSRMYAALAYQELGILDRAIAATEQVLALAEPSGFVYPLVGLRAMLAVVYGELGQPTRSLELARLALAEAERVFPPGRADGQWAMAYANLLAGNLDQADKWLSEAYASLDRVIGGSPSPLFTRFVDSEIALARRDYARMIRVADELIALMSGLGLRVLLPDALYIKSRALDALGRPDEAYALLQEARAVAEALNARMRLLSPLIALSDAEARRGNAAAAEKYRAQARELIQFIADHLGADDLRASFLNLPDVQAVMQ